MWVPILGTVRSTSSWNLNICVWYMYIVLLPFILWSHWWRFLLGTLYSGIQGYCGQGSAPNFVRQSGCDSGLISVRTKMFVLHEYSVLENLVAVDYYSNWFGCPLVTPSKLASVPPSCHPSPPHSWPTVLLPAVQQTALCICSLLVVSRLVYSAPLLSATDLET